MSREARERARRPMTIGRGGALAAPVVALALAAAPAVLTLVLIHWQLHAHLRNFTPSYWNDQVGYWTRILSFSRHGLGTGYYAPDEHLPSSIDAVRYGVNGPWFPAVYGAVAWVVGWKPYTSIFVNLGMLAAGLLAFFRLARLDVSRMLVAGAATLALWPVLLYVPTASQESLQQALAMVLAGVFVRAIKSGSELLRRERALGIAFVVVCALLRLTWAVLLVPLLLLYAPAFTRRRVLGALAVSALMILVLLKLIGLFQPEGQNSAADRVSAIERHPVDGTWQLIRDGWANLKLFLYPGNLDPTAPPVTVRGMLDHTSVQSWEIAALLVFAAFAWAAPKLRERLPTAAAIGTREALFHVANLALIVLAALTLYLPSGYYRVLGAHLLLSVLVLVAFRRMAPVVVVVALNVVMLPTFLHAYSQWSPNFAFNLRQLADERRSFAQLMPYDEHASSPWCNTMLIPIEGYDWRVTLVPPGIGVAYSLSGDLHPPLKSRYMLLPDFGNRLSAAAGYDGMEPLGKFSAGTLYLNHESACR